MPKYDRKSRLKNLIQNPRLKRLPFKKVLKVKSITIAQQRQHLGIKTIIQNQQEIRKTSSLS